MKAKTILLVIIMFTIPLIANAQYHIQFNSEADRVLRLGGDTLRGNWCTYPEAEAYYKSQSKFERDHSKIVGQDCPKNSSGAAGMDGVDMSRFKPGEQAALKITQSLLEGLFSSIFGGDKPADSAEDALKRQQAILRSQERERQQALKAWNTLREEEKKRLQAEQEEARMSGEKLLSQMGGAGGQGLDFKPISGDKFPAPKTAVEQARCAEYFSEKARELSGQGKLEEAQFMSRQAQKAMSGEPLDVPCEASEADSVPAPTAPTAVSQDLPVGINELLSRYNVKIKELLDISQRLAEVRKQKIEAEFGLKEADAKILDIKNKAASATQPEEKQKCDDLLNEALALRGQSENLLKTAEEDEKACLTSARQAEGQVKELSTKLQEGKDKK